MSKCINWCSDNSLATYCDDQCEVEHLKEKLAEAMDENGKLVNKNILLAEGNSILMQQLKEKGDENER